MLHIIQVYSIEQAFKNTRVLHSSPSDKGTPAERRGRKATGLQEAGAAQSPPPMPAGLPLGTPQVMYLGVCWRVLFAWSNFAVKCMGSRSLCNSRRSIAFRPRSSRAWNNHLLVFRGGILLHNVNIHRNKGWSFQLPIAVGLPQVNGGLHTWRTH